MAKRGQQAESPPPAAIDAPSAAAVGQERPRAARPLRRREKAPAAVAEAQVAEQGAAATPVAEAQVAKKGDTRAELPREVAEAAPAADEPEAIGTGVVPPERPATAPAVAEGPTVTERARRPAARKAAPPVAPAAETQVVEERVTHVEPPREVSEAAPAAEEREAIGTGVVSPEQAAAAPAVAEGPITTERAPRPAAREVAPPGAHAAARRPRVDRRFQRRKVCNFCIEHAKTIDYKEFARLRRYLSDRGMIQPRRKTGTCAKHQRQLSVALKRARHLALLPFTARHLRAGARTSVE